MAELDPFEARLTSAVHGFADEAATEVDAMAMAERAMGHRRPRALSWLSYPLPVPVTMLLLLGLLVLALSWALVAGGPRDDRRSVVPPAPAPTVAAVASPSPTPVPSADGQGEERVVAVASTPVSVLAAATQTIVGDVTRLRGETVSGRLDMNDPRVTGDLEMTYDADLRDGSVGPAWGTLTLTSERGTWRGSCTGAAWVGGQADPSTTAGSGPSRAWSCWLSGAGDLAGFTTYLHLGWRRSEPLTAQGLVYPGSIPAPSSPTP